MIEKHSLGMKGKQTPSRAQWLMLPLPRAGALICVLLLTSLCLFYTVKIAANETMSANTIRLDDSPQGLVKGQNIFRVHCARCHGLLGEGGEGPSLKRPVLAHAPDNEALLSVISTGIPGTGMPGTWSINDPDLAGLAAYVKSLGQLPPEAMPGDPIAGKLIYESKGNCQSCHILNGAGRGVGPELSNVGARRNSEYLGRSLTDPDADQPIKNTAFRGNINSFLTVRIVSKNAEHEDMRVNEDEFSVQMRSIDGSLHSFDKSALIHYERAFGHSLMPGYATVFSEAEISDLVSYLMSLKGR